MIKSILNPILIYPMILNLILIFLMMTPSKINKFHPISFMIILITITFLITLKMNFIFKSWLSMILFLMMIGGLLVIYLYMTSLTNNELLFLNFKMILINFIKILPFIILLTSIYIYMNESIYLNLNSNNWIYYSTMMWDLNNMNILYKKFFNKSTIFIMMYLYYSMICIMNICSNFKAPLRQMSF